MAVLLGALIAIVVVAVAVKALVSLFKNSDTPVEEAENAEVVASAEASNDDIVVDSCTTDCENWSLPNYEPDRWNTDRIQSSTNCYAYAANDPDGHPYGEKPQPGVRCGCPIDWEDPLDCFVVTAASVCDGLEPAPSPPTPKKGFYPVALVVAPDQDYHWYRMDSNGRWSHKPGHTEATDLDASGNVILNPETANRDYGRINYSNFCGYFYVPEGGVKTSSYGE